MSAENPAVDRRAVLRALLAVPVGALAGSALYPGEVKLAQEIDDHTVFKTGNASDADAENQYCKGVVSRDCDERYKKLIRPKLVIASSVLEEVGFRAIPALVSDAIGVTKEELGARPLKNMLAGRGHMKLTRREVLAGLGTSVFFGLAHNATNSGISTNRVPVTQSISGGVYWLLQRRFGIGSNIAAHSAHNFWASR